MDISRTPDAIDLDPIATERAIRAALSPRFPGSPDPEPPPPGQPVLLVAFAPPEVAT